MDIISAKAEAVAKHAGLDPHAFDIGSIITIIMQLFQGLAACKPNPTPPVVKQAITSPGLLQRRALKRTIKQNIDNPALWAHVEQGVLTVGAQSSESDAMAMFQQANGVGAVQQTA